MSLILEALKKSEAERRIGQAPGLSTPMLTRVRPRRARWPAALAVALLAALMVLAGVYWRARNPEISATATTPSPAPSAELPSNPIPATTQTASPPAAAPAPAERAPAPAVTAPASIPAPLPQDPDFASVERESIALPATDQAPAFVPPSSPAPIVPVADTIVPQGAPTVELEALPRLVDLPASQRDALPPLKLSMHVYTEDPATRFVLIDGRRLSEGATLGKALRVAQIRRDGAVLDFDGTRFILPRP